MPATRRDSGLMRWAIGHAPNMERGPPAFNGAHRWHPIRTARYTRRMTRKRSEKVSPRIRRHAWGRIEVDGAATPYKDAKLWPGGSREWDWNETGTRHEPGIQPADVQELLLNGARTVVLSRGVQRRLQIRPDTLQMLEQKGVAAHVLQTDEAVRLYNELREREAVGGLFHSTC